MRETHHLNGLSIWSRCLDYLRQKKLIPEKSPKVVFVPTDRIDRHRELADDFVINVLEKEWAYISNESSLLDFHADMSDPVDLLERVRTRYSLDVSDVPNFNIADILDRIATERAKKC